MSDRLKGKVAVVTGAGGGIGRAYALALAAEGASIVVNDLRAGDVSPAEQVVEEIESAGGQAIAIHESVSDFAGAERIVAAAVDRWGRLDILVANAGNMRPVWLREAAESDWTDLVSVHLNGTFNCIRHAAPAMIDAGGGTIITTGDITTDLHFPRLAAYRASKAAIAVLTLHAAEELREFNINANSIMPGATATRMAERYFASLDDKRDSFLEDVQTRREHGGTKDLPERTPDLVPPLGVYLCTDAARSITGRLFQTNGRGIRLVTPNDEISSLTPDGDRWTTEALDAAVPPWLATAAQ